jgi:CBS domain-containing protein
MQARDVMTTNVVSVKLDTPVRQIAELLLENKISAVPVLDQSGAVVGMVSEGDLLRMNGTERDKRREWWLALLAEGEPLSKEFLANIHANTQRTARDIMSSPVMTVSEDTELSEIGKLLMSLQIKRVPVVREGRLRGIVSRADLIRALAKQRPTRPQGEGLFGWTVHFDPFAKSEPSTEKIEEEAPADEAGLSATDFRHLVADAASKKSHQLEAARHAAEEARSSSIKELVDHHVTDERWRATLHQARLAAERGERELLLLQFPAQLCSDGGRAINVAEPDWPATLRGEAAETYLRYEHDLKPRGFHLLARVLNFPEGYIGDVGLFLHWGGAKET